MKAVSHRIKRLDEAGKFCELNDELAREEPLELRLGFVAASGEKIYRSLSITMRTPGDDFDLAVGFLWSESIIQSYDDISSIRSCGPVQAGGFQNIVIIELHAHCSFQLEKLQRHFYTSSSCGVCGKTSLEALTVAGMAKIQPLPAAASRLPQSLLYELAAQLRAKQQTFQRTGGLHASGLFAAHGELLLWGEDVGRHNALDKVVGRALRARQLQELGPSILLLSGRASFELLQKAIRASLPIVVAIGAPSSLAVELAVEFNVLLIGFLRERRFNIYHDNGYIAWEDGLV